MRFLSFIEESRHIYCLFRFRSGNMPGLPDSVEVYVDAIIREVHAPSSGQSTAWFVS